MRSLSVVIVSWNVCALLDRCLTALRADLAATPVNSQVWVVENASTDDSAAMVQARHPWVNLELPGENLGFVGGNNLVLEQLLHTEMPDAVWLLNPDTEVQPGATAALLAFMDTHPRAGLIGPQLRNTDGTLQQGGFRFPGLWQPLFDLGWMPPRFYETRLNGRYPRAWHEGEAPFRIDHPLGAAMLARGAAVSEVGPLDAQFFMYCEEIDWAWRMKEAGWQAWLAPQAKVIHHGGASSGQARPQTQTYLWQSRARLYRKHQSALIRALVRAAVRYHYTHQQPPDPAWETAYAAILQAWHT